MNNKLISLVIVCAHLCCLSFSAHPEIVPGGIAVIEIVEFTQPQAFYQNKRVMIIGEANSWQAIVGIDLNAKPGLHDIQIKTSQNTKKIQFNVVEKNYESQHITIKDKRKVNPNKLDMVRINSEKETIETAKKNWSDVERNSIDLIMPVQGRQSSPFGLRRFFNEQARKPHSGIDIAAAEGTFIKAAGKGKIINTGDYFFNGRTVFIDHGQGMLTMYCHMKDIDVSEGETVNKGDVIGSVGQSGRVTGAHLHWSVILNQTMVDPSFFIQQTQ
jgi:murein DD-endopeptidase MepM/ murein hydrolase activator NlpD